MVYTSDPKDLEMLRASVPFFAARDVVRLAPSLCRMTSSVFGGIAARNNGAPVGVLLEERIAVGDPGCRVVVALSPQAGVDSALAHRYDPPVDENDRPG